MRKTATEKTRSRYCAFLCMVALGTSAASAQSAEATDASEPTRNDWRTAVEAEVKEQHQREQHAFVTGDCETVVSFFSDDATIYRGGIRVEDLSESLAFCKQLPRPFARDGKRPEINDNFHVLSENAVRFARTIDFAPSDEDPSKFKREVVTKIWLKTNNGWKIAHFHSSTHMISNN